YSPTGDALWNSGTFTSISFPETDNGTGKAGFLFGLDTTQSAQAQTFWDGANRLGLSATVSDATGGHETFFATTTQVSPVPEPSTYLMLFGGLALLILKTKGRSIKSMLKDRSFNFA
ncbi:MAG TPA: PEP-CTERM sorting domain-containing protein, partial [Methyloradius sp.]|nr:PEP-CTERM sorting domain-containing protein [Methyloradius sp.]